MNRNEQKFYFDINRIADALESIAKKMNEEPKLPFSDGSFFTSKDMGSYNVSDESTRSSLKDLIDEGDEPDEQLFDTPLNHEERMQKINDSLDSFMNIRKPLYSRSMNLTKLHRRGELRRGEITQLILKFVKENPNCTYTDMNKFYVCFIGKQMMYDPIRDRGGSFSKHLASLTSMKVRRFDEDVREDLDLGNVMEQWLEKEDDGTYKYYERKRTLPHQSNFAYNYASSKPKVKKHYVLEFVKSCGDKGASYTDIIRYMYELEHPGEKYTTENRGWYSIYMNDGGMWNQNRKGGWINPTRSHPNEWIENRGGRWYLNTHPIGNC